VSDMAKEGNSLRDLIIRPALQDDLEALWKFLVIAAYEPDAKAAKAVPVVAAHLAGWQRDGDFGFSLSKTAYASVQCGRGNSRSTNSLHSMWTSERPSYQSQSTRTFAVGALEKNS